jgi:hypothetical protein
MDSKSMTRKDFFVLTFSLVGAAAVASNCSSSNNGGGTGGSGAGGRGGSGAGGSGTGGSGTGGRGAGGSGAGGSGTGGSGTGGSGTGGRDGGGDASDARGTGGADAGGGDTPVTPDSGGADEGSDTGTNCTLPLPEEQITLAGDNGTHVHTVTVNGATLNATTAQVINTSLAPAGANAHMHAVTFSPANLATLRGGGMVQITSALGGGGAGHTHTYVVSCHALPDAGGDATGQ